jgi:anthranilate phosphoribosyltransferase
MTPEEAARSIQEIGIGFLFAPALHPAMKHAQPVRRALKMRTVFNLLGPLANPARAQRQLIGAPSPEAAALMASALADLGTERSFVVHGHDGLDEISTTGPTEIWEVTAGHVEKHLWTPADFGVHRATLDALQGGDAARNAEIILSVLAGHPSPARDIVVVNAAAGLLLARIAPDLKSGVAQASKIIDSKAASATLKKLQKNFPVS